MKSIALSATSARAILVFVGFIAVASFLFPPRISERVDAATALPREGNAYYVRLPAGLPSGWGAWLLRFTHDSNESPSASSLRLLENGRALGPAHSVHADIERHGAGRYSHWKDHIVFSASDNSDPRKNGRAYSIDYPVGPPAWLAALLGVWALSALGAARGPRHRMSATTSSTMAIPFWVGCFVLAFYANLLFYRLLPAPLPSPDSAGYVTWSLFRTLGYPAFLTVYHWLSGTWQSLAVVQLNLLLFALFLLAYAVARLTGGYLAAWPLVAMAFGASSMLLTAANVLTEAPFAAFTMLHMALAMLWFDRPRAVLALASGACLAVAILMKSVAVVMAGPLLLALAFSTRGRRAAFAAMLVPAFAAWVAPSMYNYAKNGVFESSVAGGYAMAGHVAWAIKARPDNRYPADAALVEARLRPILDRRPPLDTLQKYIDYTGSEYNILLWANLVPELIKHHADICRPGRPACTWTACPSRCEPTLDRIMLQLSREAIAAETSRYAYHVAAHFYGLWQMIYGGDGDMLLATSRHANRLEAAYQADGGLYRKLLAPAPAFQPAGERAARLQALGDSLTKRIADLLVFGDLPEAIARASQAIPLLLAISLAASCLIFWFGRLAPPAQALCYCALCMNAYFLGTALAQPAIMRYAWPMQAIAAAMAVLALSALWGTLRGRLRNAHAH